MDHQETAGEGARWGTISFRAHTTGLGGHRALAQKAQRFCDAAVKPFAFHDGFCRAASNKPVKAVKTGKASARMQEKPIPGLAS